jgi:hypothetical protein
VAIVRASAARSGSDSAGASRTLACRNDFTGTSTWVAAIGEV